MQASSVRAQIYEIKGSGRLDPVWAAWFGDLSVQVEEPGGGLTCTVLTGPVTDQATLFGIRDLGLRLVSVNVVEPGGKI